MGLEFGTYDPPVHIDMDDLKIDIDMVDNTLRYCRVFRGDTLEKTLLTDRCRIMISPVEPVNLPKNITPYYLVEFDHPCITPPTATSTIFTTFPIEIGVFIIDDKNDKIVDIFSFIKPKYTQYGELTKGKICRFWNGGVHHSPPVVDPLREGVLELTISNQTQLWIELTRVVFYAYGMKLYNSRDLVSLRATLRILKEGMAETDFRDSPIHDGMTKSKELFQTRTHTVIQRKFMMEGGL